MTHPSMPTNDQSTRQARRDRQRLELERILEQPVGQQAQALYQCWPHKLPRLVRRALPSQLHHDWRALRSAYQDALQKNICALLDELDAQKAQQIDNRALELRQLHGAKAQEMAELISRIPNLLKMTLVRRHLSCAFNLSGTEDLKEDILDAFCLVLHEGGGVIVRQELPQRSQITDAQGNKAWVQQNRVYGAYGENGQWHLTSQANVRQSFQTDFQTGQPIPSDGFTTFGDLQDFAGKHNALVKH